MILAAELVLIVVAIPIALACGYLALLTALSGRPDATPTCTAYPKIDIVVPAHDESLGIAGTLASLSAVDYPRSRYRIFVVADNCTDDTAQRATAAGACVILRTVPEARGKGHALAFAFDGLLREGWSDAVVVVDADTVVAPDFLLRVGTRFARGAEAMQADYAVRNPDESWRTRLMAIAFSTFHELRSRARERLGVSCGLRGNGMAFTARTLRRVPWDATSLTEDVEYGARLGVAGVRVEYAGDARVFGSMPVDAKSSESQRVRWESGRAALARTLVPMLLGRGVVGAVRLDLAIDLLVPPLSWLALAVGIGTAASCALAWLQPAAALGVAPWLVFGVALAAYALRGWSLSGTGSRGLSALAMAPAYVVWKLIVRLRRRGRAAGEWIRTTRRAPAGASQSGGGSWS